MQTVTQRELARGFVPRDVSADNVSVISESKCNDGHCLRFIAVKGRHKGSTTVTLSRNEILTALNKPDEFILAIVEVDRAQTKTMYICKPSTSAPDQGACRVNYEIAEIIANGQVEY